MKVAEIKTSVKILSKFVWDINLINDFKFWHKNNIFWEEMILSNPKERQAKLTAAEFGLRTW